MVPMLNFLTAKQKSDLNNAYQAGGNMYLRPTKRQMQHGGFWAALASIGISLAINLLHLYQNCLVKVYKVIKRDLVDHYLYMFLEKVVRY